MEVGKEGDYMIPALKRAAMRAILMIVDCEGQSHKTERQTETQGQGQREKHDKE